RAVAVWCGSTEIFIPPGAVHQSIKAFEAGEGPPSRASRASWVARPRRISSTPGGQPSAGAGRQAARGARAPGRGPGGGGAGARGRVGRARAGRSSSGSGAAPSGRRRTRVAPPRRGWAASGNASTTEIVDRGFGGGAGGVCGAGEAPIVDRGFGGGAGGVC